MTLAAAIAGGFFATAPAQAAPSCIGRARTSYFGEITSVRPASFTLRTSQAIGSVHVYTHRAHVRYDGLQIRPGVYAGVYGCRWPARRALIAEDLTLAVSPQAYPGDYYAPYGTTIEGRIDAVRPGAVLIDSNGGHGNVWVLSRMPGLRTGELVRAAGRFEPADRAFVATNITVLAM